MEPRSRPLDTAQNGATARSLANAFDALLRASANERSPTGHEQTVATDWLPVSLAA